MKKGTTCKLMYYYERLYVVKTLCSNDGLQTIRKYIAEKKEKKKEKQPSIHTEGLMQSNCASLVLLLIC